MIGLLAVVVLWFALLGAVLALRSVRRAYRIALVTVLLAYGAVAGATLARSYLHYRSQLKGFDEREAAAAAHMVRAHAILPDTVRTKLVVWEADRLAKRISRIAAGYGPRVWNVRWQYGAFPSFEATNLAKNLIALVDTPPLLVYGAGEHARQAARFVNYLMEYNDRFPMGHSRTAIFVDHLFSNGLDIQERATRLCQTIDLLKDNPDDPRSRTYRLMTFGKQLVATTAKIRETMDAGFGSFDSFLFLRVRRAYPARTTGKIEWQRYSPLFIALGELAGSFQGINTLDIRWMGDPSVPVAGSTEAFYRLECEVKGPWPPGQETWTDSETGASGPVYYVNKTTAKYYHTGVRFSKWAMQPDFRVMGIEVTGQDRSLAGMPLVHIPKGLFWPPGYTGRR